MLATTAVVTVAVWLRHMHSVVTRPHAVADYQSAQWWLDYSDGFVRRGFPGQVLAWLTHGATRAWQVDVAGLALSAGGLVATCWLTWRVAAAASGLSRLVLIGAVGLSPFMLAMTSRNIGGYDPVGVIAVASIVAVRGRRAAPSIISLAALIAVLSSEFLIVFVAPVIAVAVAGADGWRQHWRMITAILTPAVAAASASVVLRPGREHLREALTAASAARSDIDVRGRNALVSMLQTPVDSLQQLEQMYPWTAPALSGFYGLCFATALLLAWQLVGRPAGFRVPVLVLACAATAMTVLGTDYRRWWALAFVAAVAVLAMLPPPERDTWRVTSKRAVLVVVVVFALGVLGQFAPLSAAGIDPHGGTTIHLRHPL